MNHAHGPQLPGFLRFRLIICLFTLCVHNYAAGQSPATSDAQQPQELFQPTTVLALPRTGVSGRRPDRSDAVIALMVTGKWETPAVDTTVSSGKHNAAEDDTDNDKKDDVSWFEINADQDGVIQDDRLRGGYVLWIVESPTHQIMELRSQRHAMVYVNGQPRYGDVYGTGFVRTPIELNRGANELLFSCPFGMLQASLAPTENKGSLNVGDPTLPDLVRGIKTTYRGAVVVANYQPEDLHGVELKASLPGGRVSTTNVPQLIGGATYKQPFEFDFSGDCEADSIPLTLELIQTTDQSILDSKPIDLQVVSRLEPHKVTYKSDVDGSVQYFSVAPASNAEGQAPSPALAFTLHGASVEATGQVAAYGQKTWAHIVGATNRRPFGFDWEDWGRIDAMEALAAAKSYLRHDPQRVYLTGHSMGGHGTWHLGATYPDHFAAIGPSAGWSSFWSYTSKEEKPQNAIAQLMRRTTLPSRTLKLTKNLRDHGIYILHGDADDNVPVEQARTMYEHLSQFHHDVQYHEQPDAGHWWDNDSEPGAACVDWPPMFDMFSRRRIARQEEIRDLSFTTANPAISSRHHWLTIYAPEKAFEPSTVELRYDPLNASFQGTSENVACMAIDVSQLGSPEKYSLQLDESELTFETANLSSTDDAVDAVAWLEKNDTGWRLAVRPALSTKGPHRAGPFKESFRNRFVLVYGTHGSDEENKWARSKARFDADSFLYRGNGAVTVLADDDFDPQAEKHRNIILYGNAKTVSIWAQLIDTDTFNVQPAKIIIGEDTLNGNQLACLAVRPRLQSDTASVGIVGGTGIVGMRMTDRLPYFSSGVAYPDVTVFDATRLQHKAGAIIAAGFFGRDWSVEQGEFVFADSVARETTKPVETEQGTGQTNEVLAE